MNISPSGRDYGEQAFVLYGSMGYQLLAMHGLKDLFPKIPILVGAPGLSNGSEGPFSSRSLFFESRLASGIHRQFCIDWEYENHQTVFFSSFFCQSYSFCGKFETKVCKAVRHGELEGKNRSLHMHGARTWTGLHPHRAYRFFFLMHVRVGPIAT